MFCNRIRQTIDSGFSFDGAEHKNRILSSSASAWLLGLFVCGFFILSGAISVQASVITLTATNGAITVTERPISGSITLGDWTETTIPQTGSTIAIDPSLKLLEGINSGSLQVTVLDTTALSLHDDIAANLTSNITSIITRRAGDDQLAYNDHPRSWQMASNGPVTLPEDTASGSRMWIEGFGGINNREGDGQTLGAKTFLGGGMVGFETQTDGDTRYGLFFGGSYSHNDVDANSQDLDTNSFFGGLYTGHTLGGYRVSGSVTGGLIQFDSDRFIANILVPGGVEVAQADYNAGFVSPQITVARGMDTSWGFQLVPSVQVGYTGIFVESFQETGSTANLSMGSRDQHMVQFRTQVALQFGNPESDGNHGWTSSLYAGVDGRANLTDDQTGATLFGQSIAFDSGGKDEVLRGLGGLSFLYTWTDALLLDGSVETGAGTDKSVFVNGRLRLIYRF